MSLCTGYTGSFTNDQKDVAVALVMSLAPIKPPTGQGVKQLISRCSSVEMELIKSGCKKVMETPREKDTLGYLVCCEELSICGDKPFYTQIWFFAVCGGVGLLLIVVIAVVAYLLCCRKKRGGGSSGGGGGMKSSKKSTKNSKK
ncbi:unnamed protein product [Caenorhabditis nigoni]